MRSKTNRLYFIDAIRAWAILMMLQGHFIDGLLDPVFKDQSSITYNIWLYFRGITAPIFFTASGFIFTYLLIKGNISGVENPRIKKGIKKGLELIFIGYLLRLNLLGLLIGEVYGAFYIVDVLHCIGFSILGIIAIYTLSKQKNKYLFPSILLAITVVLFLFEPYYSKLNFSFLPNFAANYFTKINGSVFTIFPWFGYTTFGGLIAVLFNKYKNHKHLYTTAIASSITIGLGLIFLSSSIFVTLSKVTGVELFMQVFYNNYLFIRLGDVLVAFGIFILLRRYITNNTFLNIGKSTLSIYIIHFVILYGSFTGLGLYPFLHHSLNPYAVVLGAILFAITTTALALRYEKNKAYIHNILYIRYRWAKLKLNPWKTFTYNLLKVYLIKTKLFLLKLFRLVKN